MMPVERLPITSTTSPSRSPSERSASLGRRAVLRPTSCGLAPATCRRMVRSSARSAMARPASPPAQTPMLHGEGRARSVGRGRPAIRARVLERRLSRHPACEAVYGRPVVGTRRRIAGAGPMQDSRVALVAGLVVLVLTAPAADAAAQQMDSAALAAVEAAGAAVESVRMEPAALELAVGDTAQFTV